MYAKQQLDVRASAMEILMFAPEGAGPRPGMIVCQHLPRAHAGLEKDSWQLEVGERLAKAGYAVAMPYLFHWWPGEDDMASKRERFRDDWAVADLAAAYQALIARADVDGARIGIIGHCWGGRVAWLGACHNPALKAVAVMYGGRIKASMADGAPPPITLAGKLKCRVLGIFGNEDENPSPADVDDLEAALKAAGVAYEFHRYDGAGHGFQDRLDPDRHRPTQAGDAWDKIFDFLGRAL